MKHFYFKTVDLGNNNWIYLYLFHKGNKDEHGRPKLQDINCEIANNASQLREGYFSYFLLILPPGMLSYLTLMELQS